MTLREWPPPSDLNTPLLLIVSDSSTGNWENLGEAPNQQVGGRFPTLPLFVGSQALVGFAFGQVDLHLHASMLIPLQVILRPRDKTHIYIYIVALCKRTEVLQAFRDSVGMHGRHFCRLAIHLSLSCERGGPKTGIRGSSPRGTIEAFGEMMRIHSLQN